MNLRSDRRQNIQRELDFHLKLTGEAREARGEETETLQAVHGPESRLLSMKLCLMGNSSSLLKTRLKHGIELRKSRGDAAGNGSPSALLQRGDGESQFELQGLFRMKVAATVAAHNLQLAIDGFHDAGG